MVSMLVLEVVEVRRGGKRYGERMEVRGAEVDGGGCRTREEERPGRGTVVVLRESRKSSVLGGTLRLGRRGECERRGGR